MTRKIKISILPLIGVPVFLILFQESAFPGYINRLSIQALENPLGWTGPYHPGKLITAMLMKSLSRDGKFHVAEYPSASEPLEVSKNDFKPEKGKGFGTASSSGKKDGQTGTKPASGVTAGNIFHPAQFVVQGRVLEFVPGKPPTRAEILLNTGDVLKQKAEVEVELDLATHHTGRTLVSRRFKVVTSSGVVPYTFDNLPVDPDAGEFQKSSIGKALASLTRQMVSFITSNLYILPLEGEIIFVDKDKKEVVINVGRVNGIGFGDFFNVYSVFLKYTDPFSQMDLGDKFTRRGVIRIKNIQEGFSVADIVAGDGFENGELVQSRKTNPPILEQQAGEIHHLILESDSQ
ncbi:MAG: hypothetical protein ACE5E9_04685 [Nitrospinaceae bacterium]